jgi:DNA invertase Pin-like site-specific DNA recombinase
MESRHAALYCRTSTAYQTTGLEAQVRALKTYCQVNGVNNFELYSDEGFSGTKSNRPGLDKLMAAIERGEVASVIVYSFSRFARSVTHLLHALQTFETHHVSFISISENLDTRTSTGRFVFTILAALAALEREILVERVKTGLINARAKGKRLGRPKKRPEELIKELLLRGFSYRKIASIAKCSHWSIAEVAKAMRLEKKIV